MIGLNIAGMARPKRTPLEKPQSPLHLGAWLRALGKNQAEVALGAGVNEGYVSELVSGKKTNPTIEPLLKIARYLKVPVGSLFKKPPSPEVLARLSPAHIEALGTLMEQFGVEDSPSPPRHPQKR